MSRWASKNFILTLRYTGVVSIVFSVVVFMWMFWDGVNQDFFGGKIPVDTQET